MVLAVQHPDSTELANVPEGFGDAVWQFDLTNVVPPVCEKKHYKNKPYHNKYRVYESTCSNMDDFNFVWLLEKAGKKGGWKGK